jgi:biotin operon repressor
MSEQLTIYSRTWPQQFLADFERTGIGLWLYLYLLTRQEPNSGYVRGSFERIGGELGVSVVELKKWLEQLEEEGYVVDESLNGVLVVRLEL